MCTDQILLFGVDCRKTGKNAYSSLCKKFLYKTVESFFFPAISEKRAEPTVTGRLLPHKWHQVICTRHEILCYLTH